jgi:DNA-binding response OmpR family regulator
MAGVGRIPLNPLRRSIHRGLTWRSFLKPDFAGDTRTQGVNHFEPKAFRVLVFLLRNPHRLISKDELPDPVWNDCAVSENSLTRSIALLRRLLGDDTREPRYIATVPTVGYRFLCDVEVTGDGFGGLDAASLIVVWGFRPRPNMIDWPT